MIDKIAYGKYKKMADTGQAKPFDVTAKKRQELVGTLEIENDKIGRSNFFWRDTD